MKENNSLISFDGYMGRARFNTITFISVFVLMIILGVMFFMTTINTTIIQLTYGVGATNTMLGLILISVLLISISTVSISIRRLRDITNTEKLLKRPLTLFLTILLFVPYVGNALYILTMFIPGQRTTDNGSFKFIEELFSNEIKNINT